MNYASKTKANLIEIIGIKDEESIERLASELTYAKENDDLKDQQLILLWLLFIIASVGFMF